MPTRVYLALDTARLTELLREGVLGPAPLAAYAVTPALRAEDPAADDEELEYLATAYAARASLEWLTGSDEARRIVLAADVDPAVVAPGDGSESAGVVVTAVIPLSSVASVLADDRDAEPVVRAALAGPAELAEAALEDHDLLWWATQELDGLLATLVPPSALP